MLHSVLPTTYAVCLRGALPPLSSKRPSRAATWMLLFSTMVAMLTIGCGETFTFPMTASDFALKGSGPALAAYLSQPDADPEVCSLTATGPHLKTVTPEVMSELVSRLKSGSISPATWRRCVDALTATSPAQTNAALIDTIGAVYKDVLQDSDLAKSTDLQARLRAMQRFYLERPHGMDGTERVQGALFARLRDAIAAARLGPVAETYGKELLAAYDLERGLFGGKGVTSEVIDSFWKRGDEATLLLFKERLPDETLRDEARSDVIRLRIAASPFPEVQRDLGRVLTQVMKLGRNPLSLAEHRAISASFRDGALPARTISVEEQVGTQSASLFGQGARGEKTVLPGLSTRRALEVVVDGLSRAVTVCGAPSELDPNPCILPSDLSVKNLAGTLDTNGTFRFKESLTMKAATKLATRSRDFVLGVSVGRDVAATWSAPLRFTTPPDLIFEGGAGGPDDINGPDLHVTAELTGTSRLVYRVSAGRETLLAVTEINWGLPLRIESRGEQGSTGSSGSSGSDGNNGGECQSGGSGSSGGDGGPGGDGGNGGNIEVELRCGGGADMVALCTSLSATLRRTIASRAGAGGLGGAGGSGGRGGSGGSSRSASYSTDADGNSVQTDSGCSGGSSGMNGSDGSPGPSGNPGRAGTVKMVVTGGRPP